MRPIHLLVAAREGHVSPEGEAFRAFERALGELPRVEGELAFERAVQRCTALRRDAFANELAADDLMSVKKELGPRPPDRPAWANALWPRSAPT